MHSSYIFDVLLCMYTTQAAQQFGLLVKNADVRVSLEDNFPIWAKSVVSYSKKTQIKCSAIQSETEGYNDEMEPGKVTFSLIVPVVEAGWQNNSALFCMSMQHHGDMQSLNLHLILLCHLGLCTSIALRCLALLFLPGKSTRLASRPSSRLPEIPPPP